MYRAWPLIAVFVVAAAVRPAALSAPGQPAAQPSKKPSLTLKASPMMAFTPAKVSFIGELEGGSDDYEDLYCPTVEWDWGDDTTSESTVQCEPYERGSSRIQRRFTVLHEFKIAGAYTIRLKLKKKNKVIISAQVSLQINQGVRDPGL